MTGKFDFRLNESGDLDFSRRDLQLVDGNEQIAQNTTIKLRWLFGEWFLNLSLGVPYLEEILIRNPDGRLIDARLKEAIRSTEGLLKLTAFSSSYAPGARTLRVTWAGTTIYGPIEQSLELAL